ncbi:MAG: hypothetical protein ABGX49_00230 [Candidatus Poseidoniia archaeon]|nr:hypothetical protein [Planctomycetota bacterium]
MTSVVFRPKANVRTGKRFWVRVEGVSGEDGEGDLEYIVEFFNRYGTYGGDPATSHGYADWIRSGGIEWNRRSRCNPFLRRKGFGIKVVSSATLLDQKM